MGALALSLLAACSSAYDTTFPDRGTTAAPVDVSSEDAGDGGNSGTPACPASPPAQGASCADESLFCAWGSDPRYGCRTAAICQSQTWQLKRASCPAPPPACPASAPAAWQGGDPYPPCSPEHLGLTCVYGATAFTCTVCNGSLCFAAEHGGPAYQWFATTLRTGCPDGPLPNFGDACERPGLGCDYNQCANTDFIPEVPGWARGIGLFCQGGAWTDWNKDAPVCL